MADPSLNTRISGYYDAVPYKSHPFAQTAIEHLETLAALFCLETPAPARARVLELGCASGGNLLPMAARHPQASMLGVDLSPVQIELGQEMLARVHLPNAELRVLSIADIGPELGLFDYIVCHGVYSLVPPDVQQAILRVCAQNLAPDGVAYVSYNVYPGWKAREIVRDAMMLRGGPRATAQEQLAYARGMVEFLEKSAQPDSVLKKTLDETMPLVRGGETSYLLHEFLEPCNAPCYFHEFVARAATAGLGYLCDAEPSTMFVQNYAESVREPLLRECGGSQVMMEQYLDFLVNRTFRQTLLVHQARVGDIRYKLDVDRLRGLHFAAAFVTTDGQPLTLDTRVQQCRGLRHPAIGLSLPAQKALAQVLQERYPATLPVPEMVQAVSTRLGEPAEAVEATVLAMLEALLIAGDARIRRRPVVVAAEVSAMPLVSQVARNMPELASLANAQASVCNQWHESVTLSPAECSLLPRLDRAHTHEQLAEHLHALARADQLRFMKNGQPITDEQAQRAFAREQLLPALQELRRKGLLIA